MELSFVTIFWKATVVCFGQPNQSRTGLTEWKQSVSLPVRLCACFHCTTLLFLMWRLLTSSGEWIFFRRRSFGDWWLSETEWSFVRFSVFMELMNHSSVLVCYRGWETMHLFYGVVSSPLPPVCPQYSMRKTKKQCGHLYLCLLWLIPCPQYFTQDTFLTLFLGKSIADTCTSARSSC